MAVVGGSAINTSFLDDNSSQLCGQPGHESQLAQHHHNRIPLGRRGGQQFLARTLGGFQLSVDCIYRI